MANGGIIGPPNIPTSTTATGVWQQEEQYEAKVTDTWPQRTLFTTKSLRFNDGSSDYLSRNEGAGNRRTFTLSAWCKRSGISSSNTIFSSGTNGDNYFFIDFSNNNHIQCLDVGSGSYQIRLDSNRLIRDLSAWYHIVLAIDTTQGTASNRVKLYVNGVQETSFSTATYPDQDADLDINTQNVINLGRDLETSSDFIDMYLAEFVFIDGQSLAPTSFGEENSQTGIWVPKSVTGLTFGTNGFYLPFTNASALGEDFSGNNNDFTVNNLTATDQSTDTCTNNFATVNSLDSFYEASTFSEGNLKIVTEASLYSYNTSTIGLTQGKWYCEVYIETSPHPTTKDSIIGIAGRMSEGNDNFLGQSSDTYGIYGGNGNIYNNGGTTSYGVTHTTNDIVGIYMDLDNNKLYFAKNGTIMNSGTGHTILAPNLTTAGAYFMVAADYGNGYQGTYRMNFGSPIYALSSANTDANGFGSFEYNPSSGTFDGASKDFLAICTKNLAEFG